jgi:hypothetical protein
VAALALLAPLWGATGCSQIDSQGLGPEDPGLADVEAPTDTATGDGATGDASGVDASVDAIIDVIDASDGGPCAPGTGNAGTAIELSSADQNYLESPYFPIPLDFTIEAWVQPVGSSEQIVVSKETQGTTANQFRFGLSSLRLYFIMSDVLGNDGGLWRGSYALQAPTPLPIESWSHVAVVKRSTAISLLVDGTIVASFNTSTNLVHSGIAPFRIGAGTSSIGPVAVLDGTIDEVRVFRVAREAADVACDRFHELDPSHPQWSSLAAYWKLDDGKGSVALDAKLAFPANLVNTPTWVKSTAF